MNAIPLNTITPPDLTPWLGTTKNRIRAVGIELEGGWSRLPPGVTLVRDGSVTFGAPTPSGDRQITIDPRRPPPMPTPSGPPSGPPHVGELPSDAMTITEWATWVRTFYPSH